MKKSETVNGWFVHPLKKTFLIMRIVVFLLLAAFFQTQANSAYAQRTKLSLNHNQTSLEKVLDAIENQSEFFFLYNEKLVDVHRKVSIKAFDQRIEDILNQLFAGTDVEYSIIDRKIVLAPDDISSFVQQGVVSGNVTDRNGAPLPGVTVLVKGTTTGTITNNTGYYSLTNVPDNATLIFSFVGMRMQEIQVIGQTSINVTLQEDTYGIEEIVAIGYGVQKKVTLTGSISVIDAKSIENRPLTNSSQALQGVRGIYVNQAGGAMPGSDGATIRIRGLGTIGGAGKLNPLVLIDGVELSFDDINPNDIETISVLKDAASTAIYGSRAANGVILITTKMGKTDRISFDYDGYYGIQKATYLPDPVDNSADFMEWYNKAQVNQGSAPYYSQDLINQFRNNPTSLIYPNTNWMDLMFGNAPMHEHNLRLSGGSQKTTFNVSTGYLDQQGILLKGLSAAKKYSLNMRINSQVSKRLNLEASLMGNIWDVDEPSRGIGTFMNRLMRMVPLQPVGKLENGNWADSWVVTPGQNSFEGPIVWAEESYRQVMKYSSTGTLAAKYDIIKGLTYQVKGSYNNRHQLVQDWNPMIQLYNPVNGNPGKAWSGTSTKEQEQSFYERLNLTNILNYQTTINDVHSITALIGASHEKFNSKNMSASVQGFPTMDLTELSIGTANQTVSGSGYTTALISYFGRIQYSYKDRYLFEANGRYDGSSRFAKDNRWGFFPSFSAGWRLSEEEFMANTDWINELKIRSSWGQIGNQEIGLFQYVNAVALGYGYPFGGTYGAGAAIVQSRDPEIRWETTTMLNFGLDWVFFNGLLGGEAEYFHKRTNDILRGITLPAQVGALAGPTSNIATVDNTGFEIALTHRNRINNDLSYEIGGHISKIKNEVVDLNGEKIISGGRITQEGSPIDSWYVLKTDGLFKTADEVKIYPTITNRVGPGDIKYLDLNDDKKIDGNDRYIAGNSFPDYTYGFNAGITYKSLSLETMWQGVGNLYVRPNFNMASPFNNGAGLTKDWITDSWTPDNPNARLPRISARNQYTNENFSDSDFWLEDASYLRLKSITLSYQLSTGLFLTRMGINRMKIYANGQNLLTFSEVRHFDPERNITQTDINQYPTAKTISLGVSLNF